MLIIVVTKQFILGCLTLIGTQVSTLPLISGVVVLHNENLK